MPEARQAQLSELSAQLSALGFQVSPIAPSGPQAFYGARPSNNNKSNNNNRGNRNNSRETGANSHVTLYLEAMDNSEAYYDDDALHVGNAQKSDVCSTFKSFVQMIERQFTIKLKNVQIDWGGDAEFVKTSHEAL
ncbi:hypothetical protein Tco_0099166 [Tanacetum coccineum]